MFLFAAARDVAEGAGYLCYRFFGHWPFLFAAARDVAEDIFKSPAKGSMRFYSGQHAFLFAAALDVA